MSSKPKILAFAGSAREGSFNKKLIRIAVAEAKAAGGDVTLIDLRDFPMPLYEGDLEEREGLPPNGLKLRELMLSHQGFLLSCPEYNSSITPLLKNSIDWVSRPTDNDPGGLLPYKNKVAALMSASPGALGGLRGLVTVRMMLSNIGVLVLPTQVAVMKAHEAFNPGGSLINARQHASIRELAKGLVKILEKLTG